MKTILQIASALLALAILAGVIHLGILSGSQSKFVVWFGIASAIAAPLGLSLLGYAFARTDGDLIQRLSKVPEIDRLIAEAKSQEEKLHLLEAERSRLADVIRLESRRQAARDRIESLERDEIRILDELKLLNTELLELDVEIGQSIASAEIEQLRERVQSRINGDLYIHMGTKGYRVDRSFINAIPFGFGNLLVLYFRFIDDFSRKPIFKKSSTTTNVE